MFFWKNLFVLVIQNFPKYVYIFHGFFLQFFAPSTEHIEN